MTYLPEGGRRLDRGGPALAALLAAGAALPGLAFPFLSDDWHLVESVGTGLLPASSSLFPYGYFRPLYTATFWIDRKLWGSSPCFFHLTNLLLMAAAAALVVTVVRRYTGDPRLAALTGVLFALHPYHVENAAWIAVRGDPLYSVLLLASAWAYDRWKSGEPARAEVRGMPLAAILLFEGALLAKESAVVLPVMLLLVGLLGRARRLPSSCGGVSMMTEGLRGLLPMGGVALVHFFVLRTLVMPTAGRTLAPGTVLGWMRHALGFIAAAVLPVDAEILAARPLLWGGAAALGTLALMVAARARAARVPATALAAAALFLLLLAPSIVGFQERYLYLPLAGSCLFLASLVVTLRGGAAAATALLLTLLWLAGSARHWSNWSQAAAASRRLVSDLVDGSAQPGVREIVVANMPFRVRGGSVAGDFRAAIGLSGGVPVPVSAVTYVSYPDADAPALVEDQGRASPVLDEIEGRTTSAISISRVDGFPEVRMLIPDRPFSHYVAPRPRDGAKVLRTPAGAAFFEGQEKVRVRIDAAPEKGRAAYAWGGGRLIPLFMPAPGG